LGEESVPRRLALKQTQAGANREAGRRARLGRGTVKGKRGLNSQLEKTKGEWNLPEWTFFKKDPNRIVAAFLGD